MHSVPTLSSLVATLALLSQTTTASPRSTSPLLARDGSCSVVEHVTHTFYGYPDNSPPGPAIAYTDCGRDEAGGTGTFDDPLTFATASGEFERCEVIYAPYLKKYLRYEDECAQCNEDWGSGIWHVDTWTGSSSVNGGDNQIQCENELTPDAQSIIRNPSSDLEVDDTPLYENGSCNTGSTYTDYDAYSYC